MLYMTSTASAQGCFPLERLNILLHAYDQTKRIGLHNTAQLPVLDAATEIAGLLQRYKLQMSSLSNISKKAKDSNTYCTPRLTTASSKNGHYLPRKSLPAP